MTKPARLSLIASICKRLGRGAVRPPVLALPSEVKEEVALASAHNDDQSIIDVDTDVQTISPELASVIEPSGKAHRIRTDDAILTPSERRQLAAEVQSERRKWWLVPVFNQPSQQTQQAQTA